MNFVTENQLCVRVEKFPRTHNTAVASGNPNDDGGEQNSAESSSCRGKTTSMGKAENKETRQKKSLKDTGHSSDQEPKKSGTERTPKPNGLWNHAADMMMMMMIHLRESGHPPF